MKKITLFLIGLFATITLACGFSFSTASVAEAYLAKDEQGTQRTTTFSPTDAFYLVGKLANAPDSTKLKAVWTAVAVDYEGVEPNTQLGEFETTGGGDFHFTLSNDNPWPTGKYKADLYLNDELNQTFEFTVEAPEAAASAPTPTPEPEPAPTPTAALEPNENPLELLLNEYEKSEEEAAAASQPAEEAEAETAPPLPLAAEPVQGPNGAFSLTPPEGWQAVGDDSATSLALADPNGAAMLSVEFDRYTPASGGEFPGPEQALNEFAGQYVADFLSDSPNHEILEERMNEDGTLFVALAFESPQGMVDADMLFELAGEDVIYTILFATTQYDSFAPTFDAVYQTYTTNPDAARQVLAAQ